MKGRRNKVEETASNKREEKMTKEGEKYGKTNTVCEGTM